MSPLPTMQQESGKPVMLFSYSPMYPELEDLPLKTRGGHANLELRSTEDKPLSTGAARRVLGRSGHRLLASKITVQTGSLDHKPPKSVENELQSLKEHVNGLQLLYTNL